MVPSRTRGGGVVKFLRKVGVPFFFKSLLHAWRKQGVADSPQRACETPEPQLRSYTPKPQYRLQSLRRPWRPWLDESPPGEVAEIPPKPAEAKPDPMQ